jgi:hypothetical protein
MLQDDQFMGYDAAEDHRCQEHTRNLFGQPDVLLVNEYLHVYQSNFAETPEMKLVAAILKDGIDCYIKHLSSKQRRWNKLSTEAEEWFMSEDENWLFSFENVCAILKLEPDYIRRALLHYKQEYAKFNECKQPLAAARSALSLRLAS